MSDLPPPIGGSELLALGRRIDEIGGQATARALAAIYNQAIARIGPVNARWEAGADMSADDLTLIADATAVQAIIIALTRQETPDG